MTTIKEAALAFPLLAFRTDGYPLTIPDIDELTICPVQAVKRGTMDGMEIVDALGNTWKVLKTRIIRRHLSYEWLFLPVVARIDYDLERQPDVPLATLKERLIPEIRNGATHYFDWRVEDEAVPALEAQVAAATSVSDLCRILDEGYE